MTKQVYSSRKDIRLAIRAQRKSLSLLFQSQQAELLTKRLSSHSNVKQAKAIAIYIENDGEISTQPFIKFCWKNNIDTYLPVIHPFSKGQLLFLRYHAKTRMVKNSYGISEPALNVHHIIPLESLDIIFTPLVAFDKQGNRLGMGGGFYDRTLKKWHDNYKNNVAVKPYPVGLAHDCQMVNKIPSELWDIPLPEIITPSTTLYFEK